MENHPWFFGHILLEVRKKLCANCAYPCYSAKQFHGLEKTEKYNWLLAQSSFLRIFDIFEDVAKHGHRWLGYHKIWFGHCVLVDSVLSDHKAVDIHLSSWFFMNNRTYEGKEDNSCGKNSWKSFKCSPSYGVVCQLALLIIITSPTDAILMA